MIPPRRDRWEKSITFMSRVPIGLSRLPVVRDGTKGPLIVEILKRSVVGRSPKRQEGYEEVLVVIRYREGESTRVAAGGLLLVRRFGRHAAGGVHPGGESGAPDRRVSATGQARNRTGRLPSSELDGLASSSDAVPAGPPVPGDHKTQSQKAVGDLGLGTGESGVGGLYPMDQPMRGFFFQPPDACGFAATAIGRKGRRTLTRNGEGEQQLVLGGVGEDDRSLDKEIHLRPSVTRRPSRGCRRFDCSLRWTPVKLTNPIRVIHCTATGVDQPRLVVAGGHGEPLPQSAVGLDGRTRIQSSSANCRKAATV